MILERPYRLWTLLEGSFWHRQAHGNVGTQDAAEIVRRKELGSSWKVRCEFEGHVFIVCLDALVGFGRGSQKQESIMISRKREELR